MSHPSVFPQGTIAKDKYYYAFYTVSKKDLNTIHMKLYDNNRTLVEEKSHKFSSINAVELLKKINNNGTNPLVIGHNTDASSNIDIAASNLYQQGWNNKQQDRLMRDINQDYGNVYSNVTETYDISYNGATYSLTQNGIDVSSTDLYVKPGLHVFDLNSLSRNNQSFLTFEPLTYGSTLPAIYNEGTLGSTYLYQTLRVDDFTPDMKFYIIPGQDLGRIYNNFTSAPARIFEVSVVNGVYYIDGIEKPKLFLFKDGNYVFLQTTADNTGNLLQFSSSSFENGLVVFNDGVLTKGIPGNQTYAYSAIEFSGDSSVYYYNYDVSNVDMGNRITRADFDVSLNVQVETNLQGQNVFAFYNVDLDTHIKQSVLPITYTADYNKVYYFDMSHISNSGEILTFGFNSDIDSGSTSAFDISYATHSLESPGSAGAFVALDLRDFYYEAVTARSVDYGLYDKSYSGVSFKVLFASGLPDGSGVFQVVDSQGGIISIQSPASTTLLYGKSEVDIVLAPNVPTGTYYIQDANNPSMDVLTIDHEYAYSVSVVNNVFHINSVPQAQISFVKNQTYKFIQSDSSNAGKLIVFGRNYDSATLYTIGVVHNGTPGQPGAYTELTLDNNFAGNLYYYSSAAPNMGYSPVSITTDTTTKSFNDTLAFHISNNTGTDVSYAITGVDASDLSGVSYTGILTYGTIHTLNYIVRTVGKTAVMTAGAATTTITISDVNDAYKYTFGIQTSYYGQSVFATYDSVANVWYNQPNISFSAPNIYVIDLSSSIVNGGYNMVFGPTADDLGTLLSDSRVLRKPTENRIILDLDGYSGSVVYFEDSSGGMGYMNPSNTQYTYVVEALSNPYVYSLSGTPQQQIVFNPSTSYVFDQSDSTNIGQQLVFGRNYDDKTNLYTTNVRTIGTLGRPGAYTQIDLDPGFSGNLFYYSDASNNMGYAPLSLAVDGTSKLTGDIIIYTVSNNTGADVPYTITGIVTTDINNEPLTGNIPYGQTTILTYTMTNTSTVNMTMTVGTESQTVNVIYAMGAQVRVQNNKYELSEDGGTTWITTPIVYLTYPNLYAFVVSDSTNTGYEITFGTTIDDLNSVDNTLITRQGIPGQSDALVFLDLTSYNGGELFYFDSSYSNMGYVPGSMKQIDVVTETKTVTTSSAAEVFELPEELVLDSDYKIGLTYTQNSSGSGIFGIQSDTPLPYGSYAGEDPNNSSTWKGHSRTGIMGQWQNSDYIFDILCSTITLSSSITYNAPIVLELGRINNVFYINMNGELFSDPVQKASDLYMLYKEATLIIKRIIFGNWTSANSSFNGSIHNLFVQYPDTTLPLLLTTTTYKVRVQNGVYAFSVDDGITWTEKPQIFFKPYDNLIFDQSDSTNSGEQIVFGTTVDDKANVLGAADGVTVVGTPGTSGAYTQLILGASFSGDLYYYSAGSNNMGYKLLPTPYTHYTFENINGTTVLNETNNGSASLLGGMQPRTFSKFGSYSISPGTEVSNTTAGLLTNIALPANMFNNNFTMSIWVNLYLVGYSRIISDIHTDLLIFVGSSIKAYPGNIELINSTDISTDTWYNIVMVNDKTNDTITYYLDGVSKGTTTNSGYNYYDAALSQYAPTSNFSIGGGKNGASYYDQIFGYIDDFRFYTEAFNESQVNAIYNGG